MSTPNRKKRKSRKKQKQILHFLLLTALFFCLLLGILLILRHSFALETRTVQEFVVETETIPETESETIPETESETVPETTEEETLPPGMVSGITLSFYHVHLHEDDDPVMPRVFMQPEDAIDISEIWSSSDETVAIVDENGTITPENPGNCTICVTSAMNPAVSATVMVTVYPKEEALPVPEQICSPFSEEDNTRNDIQVIGGITYVQGVMLVNKTYSLPADYHPDGLTPETSEAFSALRHAASDEAGLRLFSESDFRSYRTQVYLYESYCNRDGKEAADRFSARPGHSEHQTGMVIDVNWAGDAFNDTEEAVWLEKNCWRFGFIVRFPREKEAFTGYKYESWHIRYVGEDWAKKIYDSGLCLEEYFHVSSRYS